MSFLQRMLATGSVTDERMWGSGMLGGVSTAREYVSYNTALKIAAYYACVSLIADTIGLLPKYIIETLADGSKKRAESHPLYDLMHLSPNPRMTAIEFFTTMTAHLTMRNNAYAQIVAGPRGFVDQLYPLHPDGVIVEPLPDGAVRYRVRQADGSWVVMNDDQVLHIKGISLDGVKGLDMIGLQKESVGTALATQKYRGRFFGNGAAPGGVIKVKGRLSPEAIKRLSDSWADAHAGDSQHRPAVLEEGYEWQSTGIDPKAAQLVEVEEFQANDICQWFRVPPSMIGLPSKATSWAGTGIEQQSIAFVTYTILPIVTRWQQAISRDLILVPKRYSVEFIVDGLLRGDSQARYNVYRMGRELGVFSANDIRRLENMNPRTDPDGDTYIANMGRSIAPEPEPDDPLMEDDLLEPPDAPLDTPGDGPGTPGVLPDAPNDLPTSHYTELLFEAARRIARKEMAALTRVAKRENWHGQVDDFYGSHAAYVAAALCMPEPVAAGYVARQVQALKDAGPQLLSPSWQTAKVAELVALAVVR